MGFIPERESDSNRSDDARPPAEPRERDSVTDDLLEGARDSLHEALSMLASSRLSLRTLASARRDRRIPEADEAFRDPQESPPSTKGLP